MDNKIDELNIKCRESEIYQKCNDDEINSLIKKIGYNYRKNIFIILFNEACFSNYEFLLKYIVLNKREKFFTIEVIEKGFEIASQFGNINILELILRLKKEYNMNELGLKCIKESFKRSMISNEEKTSNWLYLNVIKKNIKIYNIFENKSYVEDLFKLCIINNLYKLSRWLYFDILENSNNQLDINNINYKSNYIMEIINNWQNNSNNKGNTKRNYLKMILWLIDIGFKVNNKEDKNFNNNLNNFKKYIMIYKLIKYKQKKVKEKVIHIIKLQNIYRYNAYNPYNGKIYLKAKKNFEHNNLLIIN